MKAYFFAVSFLALFVVAPDTAISQAENMNVPEGREADAEEIWSKELKIYEMRRGGDMGFYLSLANPGYMSWPASIEEPLSFDRLSKQVGDGQIMEAGELIDVTKKGLSFDGDTALAFFETHRTRRAGGEAVDERFENIHVWVKREGDWRLIANMSRSVVDDRRRLGNPTLRERN